MADERTIRAIARAAYLDSDLYSARVLADALDDVGETMLAGSVRRAVRERGDPRGWAIGLIAAHGLDVARDTIRAARETIVERHVVQASQIEIGRTLTQIPT